VGVKSKRERERERERERYVGVTGEFSGTGELTAVWKTYKTRSKVFRKCLPTRLSDQER
jgi:hypothetical protein